MASVLPSYSGIHVQSLFWLNWGLLAGCASTSVTRATGMAFEINTSVSHSQKIGGGWLLLKAAVLVQSWAAPLTCFCQT